MNDRQNDGGARLSVLDGGKGARILAAKKHKASNPRLPVYSPNKRLRGLEDKGTLSIHLNSPESPDLGRIFEDWLDSFPVTLKKTDVIRWLVTECIREGWVPPWISSVK